MAHTPERFRTKEHLTRELTDRFMPIVRDRPVGLICPGHSLSILDENIDKFADIDICWGTMNFHPDAKEILAKINKKPEFMLAYCPPWKKQEFDGLKLTCADSRGGTVHEFLLQCITANLPLTVFIFGMDGCPVDKDKLYYKDRTRKNPYQTYLDDTKTFNESFPLDRKLMRIYNVSPHSRVTVLTTLTLEECLYHARRK